NSFTQLHSATRQTLTQCLAFDQFTGDVMNRVILTDLVNGQNIWMVESNHRARFLSKPLQPLGVARKTCGQEFESSLAARNDVGGQIDFTHPAGADHFRNFVVANRLPDERLSFLIPNNLRRETDS